MPIIFSSCLSSATTPLNHAWEHTVGSSRALLAPRADWQAQLQRCHDELVRFHALLTDDMGTFIAHQEKPLYSFINADRIWDFLLSIGMLPSRVLSTSNRNTTWSGISTARSPRVSDRASPRR